MKGLNTDETLPLSDGKTGGNSLMRYSMELAMLARLRQDGRITADEFHKIRQGIMNSYHVLSDITAVNA